MGKNCSLCNRKVLLLSEKTKDGMICTNCKKKLFKNPILVFLDKYSDKQCRIISEISKQYGNTPLTMTQETELEKMLPTDDDEAFKNEVTELYENQPKREPKQDNRSYEEKVLDRAKHNGSHKFDDWYYFDDENQMLVTKTPWWCKYTYIVDYKKIEETHDETKRKHGVARALTGGIIAGPVGAIAGAVSGHDKVKEFIDRLGVTVYLKDGATMDIMTIRKSVKASDASFQVQEYNLLCRKLNSILVANQNAQQSQPAEPVQEDVEETDAAEQIRKFKSLLDDGIITEEEFEAKKKQLLDL